MEQVPGKRDRYSSQRATNGCQGQYLGCGEVRDKIPVGFGKAGMSQRGDGAVAVSQERSAEPGLPRAPPATATTPSHFSKRIFFFQANCTLGILGSGAGKP